MKKMTEEKLKEIVKESFSIAEVLKKLKMSITTGNYKSFHKAIKIYKIDTTHFLGQAHLKNKSHNTKRTIPFDEILIENSTYTSTSELKRRLVKEKLIEYYCAICKIIEWHGKLLSLQLDHINGINTDNRIENLRLLCPNCHSQTDTFCGKNIKINRVIPEKPQYDYCICGKEKRKRSKMCRSCSASKREKIDWPSMEELQIMVDNEDYSKVARKLHVSPTSVKNKLLSIRDSNSALPI